MRGAAAARQGGRSDGTVGLLSRLLPLVRRAFPRARILVRLDGGFASPAVFDFLDAAAARLRGRDGEERGPAATRRAGHRGRSDQTEHVYTETDEYRAGKWSHARRVVIGRGRSPRGPRAAGQPALRGDEPAADEREGLLARGDVENRIKELKALQIDRLPEVLPNQLRVLPAAAYVLMQELRLRAADTACARAQVPWLRDRLLKLGVQVVRSVRRIVLRLPTPDLVAWRQIAFALGARTG